MTATLTFRIEPNIKEVPSTAAARDHRSIASMMAVMRREHCARLGIAILAKKAAAAPVAATPEQCI